MKIWYQINSPLPLMLHGCGSGRSWDTLILWPCQSRSLSLMVINFGGGVYIKKIKDYMHLIISCKNIY